MITGTEYEFPWQPDVPHQDFGLEKDVLMTYSSSMKWHCDQDPLSLRSKRATESRLF
jgi:hypothetical protein